VSNSFDWVWASVTKREMLDYCLDQTVGKTLSGALDMLRANGQIPEFKWSYPVGGELRRTHFHSLTPEPRFWRLTLRLAPWRSWPINQALRAFDDRTALFAAICSPSFARSQLVEFIVPSAWSFETFRTVTVAQLYGVKGQVTVAAAHCTLSCR